MKARASIALTTTALALTAVVVPAAHADDRPTGSAAAAAPSGPKISNVSVNGGKDVTVGVSHRTFTVTFTVRDPEGIKGGIAALWRGGPDAYRSDKLLGPADYATPESQCKRVDSTTSRCSVKLHADTDAPPEMPEDNLQNADAGRWNLVVRAEDRAGSVTENHKVTTHLVKRAAKVTVNASPEPIKKGKTLTVAGSLTRANWDTLKYAGFASSTVKLQFKKNGATRWETVKTVSADSRGKVKATTKASVDGSYRFTYGGTTSTGSASSKADAVNVT
ncbi:calcium-binding protein [Streptomyces sp. NPDC005955]|uniref:calcium-binding protein n=1 Tax=Streptomyces sp. NPDC005955 TaxID=3364738 RepID=UPI00367822C1